MSRRPVQAYPIGQVDENDGPGCWTCGLVLLLCIGAGMLLGWLVLRYLGYA